MVVPLRFGEEGVAGVSTRTSGASVGTGKVLAGARDPTPERASRGRALRSEAPRSSQGQWAAPPGRPDPITLLERQDRTRIPELVPIRYGRMASSPLSFYRGAAVVMAEDLASTPRSGLLAQLCGDAHLSNFGLFGAPDRRIVFDLNDFDETLRGPWEWDLKRLAASLEIAAREQGVAAAERDALVTQAAARYRTTMREFAQLPNLEVWYARLEEDALLTVAERQRLASRREIKQARRQAEKATHKDSRRALAKLTHQVDGEARFISEPPLIVPADELAGPGAWQEPAGHLLAEYRGSLGGDVRHLVEEYRFADLARKVVGVGSVGTRAWVALHLGADGEDALFLQIKEAQASVLEPFAGRSRFRNHGRRVVEGQRLMQGASDVLLGWFRGRDLDGREHDFYVRQLWDWKGSADVATLGADALLGYGSQCSWTLARAHARSGDRVAIAAYLGGGDSFDVAIARFCRTYADQNERDHQALLAAIEAGRIEAETGV